MTANQTPPSGIPAQRGGATFAPASSVFEQSNDQETGPRVVYANPLVNPKPKPDAGNGS